MATFYGSDSSCLTDVGLSDIQITDPFILIGQRIARRLQTPRGGLAAVNDDPSFGFDVRQLLNARLDPSTTAYYQQQIAAECQKDEEVSSANVTLTFVQSTGVLTIQIQLVASPGPFSLTLNVSQLTTTAVFSF